MECRGETIELEDIVQTRHLLESGAYDEERQGDGVDENGNPTQRHIHPIMSNNVRPVSIYRHTPVFRPQKLTVPTTVNNSGNSTAGGYGSTANSNGVSAGQDSDRGKDPKRKGRRKKLEEEKNVVKAEEIEGYRGNKDIDSLLEFLGEGEEKKKKSKKSTEKTNGVEKNTKKVTNKSDQASKDDQKLRKKKEKSQEKESVKPSVTKKLSIDTIDNEVIEEEDDEKAESEENENNSLRPSISPEKESSFTHPGIL